MVIKRDSGFVMIVKEPAKTRIANDQCPVCGLPKTEWKRRTDWRCCSTECTDDFERCVVIRSWPQLRWRAYLRDNKCCVKCGKEVSNGCFVGDHIIPIALGGFQWELDNIQTLCYPCNKVKTAQDSKDIAKQRSIDKTLRGGQRQLGED